MNASFWDSGVVRALRCRLLSENLGPGYRATWTTVRHSSSIDALLMQTASEKGTAASAGKVLLSPWPLPPTADNVLRRKSTMPSRNGRLTPEHDVLKLEALRRQINAGIDALERGEMHRDCRQRARRVSRWIDNSTKQGDALKDGALSSLAALRCRTLRRYLFEQAAGQWLAPARCPARPGGNRCPNSPRPDHCPAAGKCIGLGSVRPS